MNLIFLDIDGVLNSMAYFEWLKSPQCTQKKNPVYNEISDFHLQMLAKICHACDVKIVLSSTWRELDDPSEKDACSMYQYLADRLAEYDMKIYSKTPCIQNNRPLEIATWLGKQERLEAIRFVILDDDFSKEDYDVYGIGNQLVQTQFFCEHMHEGGLQQKHVNQAIAILNR